MVPSEGKVKCNIGAAFFKESNSMGIGALALMEAIRWLRSMNMDIVIFEVDSQRVSNGMKRRSLDPSEFGIIIMQCKECLFG